MTMFLSLQVSVLHKWLGSTGRTSKHHWCICIQYTQQFFKTRTSPLDGHYLTTFSNWSVWRKEIHMHPQSRTPIHTGLSLHCTLLQYELQSENETVILIFVYYFKSWLNTLKISSKYFQDTAIFFCQCIYKNFSAHQCMLISFQPNPLPKIEPNIHLFFLSSSWQKVRTWQPSLTWLFFHILLWKYQVRCWHI